MPTKPPFTFTLTILLKNYYYTAQLIEQDKMRERWKVERMGERPAVFILESNRPFIRDVKKLRHRRLDWKVIEGGDNATEVEMIRGRLEGV